MVSRIPLAARPDGDVLFRLHTGDVTAGAFAAAALQLSGTLPSKGAAINVCNDRYAFALAFAAALLRGHVSLLSSDRSAGRLAALARDWPDSYVIDDGCTARAAALGPPPPMPTIPADQTAAVVFTSGSTGAPVGHRKLWGALAERSRDAAAAFGVRPDRPACVVGTVPPQHMYGFETTVLWPLHAALSVWCGPVFYPADTRAALAASPGARLLITTPLQLRGLLEGPALTGVASVISATAPLEADLAARVERAWGAEVREIFGATEIGSIAARRTVTDTEWQLYRQVTLRPAADRMVATAPWTEPTPLDDEVALRPGGRFQLLGRRSDLVKLAGRRASLAGLNRILLDIEGVQDGVFVPPDAAGHRAARMTAFVVAPGRDAASILAELRTRIDPAFLPRRLVQVERLPRTELGKLPAEALDKLQAAD